MSHTCSPSSQHEMRTCSIILSNETNESFRRSRSRSSKILGVTRSTCNHLPSTFLLLSCSELSQLPSQDSPWRVRDPQHNLKRTTLVPAAPSLGVLWWLLIKEQCALWRGKAVIAIRTHRQFPLEHRHGWDLLALPVQQHRDRVLLYLVDGVGVAAEGAAALQQRIHTRVHFIVFFRGSAIKTPL